MRRRMYRNNDLINKTLRIAPFLTSIYANQDSVQVAFQDSVQVALENSSSNNFYYIIILVIGIGYVINTVLRKSSKKDTVIFFNSLHQTIINYLIENNYDQEKDLEIPLAMDDVTTKELFKNINSVQAIELVLMKQDANTVNMDVLLRIAHDEKEIDVKISQSYSWGEIPENYRAEFISSGKSELRFSLYA